MDSRLQRVGNSRLVRLLYSDAPRVAQAIVDYMGGQCRLLSGVSHDTTYVEFLRSGHYTVVIRGDDWKVIFPFIRYGSGSFSPVTPPPTQPQVISPQPQRLMSAPPVNPGRGLTTFLAGIPYDRYIQIQKLLTVSNLSQDGSDNYTRLVGVLQQLFPTDFPTYRM